MKPARYEVYNMADAKVIQSLATASQTRVSQSDEFKKLLHRIDRYMEQKAKKQVTLKEKDFFAERAEFDAEKEDEKQLEDQAVASDEVVKRDYYMN